MSYPNVESTSPSAHFDGPNSTSRCSVPVVFSALPLSIAMPIFTMTLGALSNIIGLGILVKSHTRFRQRSKAAFLLLASSLLFIDFAGHVIPGAFALRLYTANMRWDDIDRSGALCQLFGACMVFFGLCPLFLSGAMALERCIGVTKPLLHSREVTSRRAKLAVALMCCTAFLIAILPLLKVGRYTRQFPDTWCFVKIHGQLSAVEFGLSISFSMLGLVSLALSLLCNSLSGLALLKARLSRHRPASSCQHNLHSHDIEMIAQLLGIMLVSCVCWSPFLVRPLQPRLLGGPGTGQ
ncbi:prostaglandin E2 receptor EP1 subtype-like [Erpetoichthys calabaricus]|uniref:prostaglandin E2 receptor EP1 subtype-like n=1 Tax=Erpetoichthys calabaricus TaxID=27687 RepID=UPI002234A3B3|nr:prostaglandin E2 receptor EP1 subtype-like [Erpetoichthys calabaricus]